MTEEQRKSFNSWYNDGNAIKLGFNKYLEQSSQYSKVFSLLELQSYFIKEYHI